MTPHPLDVPDWHHATALNERFALLRARRDPGAAGEPLESERARRWREQVLFRQRLSSRRGSHRTGSARRSGGASWRSRHPLCTSEPGGHPRSCRASSPRTSTPPTSPWRTLRPDPRAPQPPSAWRRRVLCRLGAAARQGRAHLREGLRALVEKAPFVPFDPAVVERLWLLDLPGEMLSMVDRTFVLEMHVARMQGLLRATRPKSGSRASSSDCAILRSCSPSSGNTRCSRRASLSVWTSGSPSGSSSSAIWSPTGRRSVTRTARVLTQASSSRSRPAPATRTARGDRWCCSASRRGSISSTSPRPWPSTSTTRNWSHF